MISATRIRLSALAVLLCMASIGQAAHAATLLIAASKAGPVRVERVAEGLDVPWSLAFLPDGRMLVSERAGRLRLVGTDGAVSPPLAGVPAVYVRGQGGLLDVVVSPDFAADGLIFFSFSERTPDGVRTAVARARLEVDHQRLAQVKEIFAQRDDPDGRHHFGSRLVVARDGTLFVTLGERYTQRDKAQDLASHLGKVVRIRPDGSVPADNPFVGRKGAQPEIWSYGHRNVQGAALNPRTGQLWTHEHGPQGGDEVNIDRAGANYGWPVITYGREYVTGFAIGEGTTRPDIVPPVHQWTPSIAPSGMAFYSGKLFPVWQGSLFVGSLKFGMLSRLSLDGDRVVGEERLLGELGHRIRDVRQGPDGALYVLDETDGQILRLSPAR